MTADNELRAKIAHALWREEARSAPSVMKQRTMEVFLREEGSYRDRWLGYADAALAALIPAEAPAPADRTPPDDVTALIIRAVNALREVDLYDEANAITVLARQQGEV